MYKYNTITSDNEVFKLEGLVGKDGNVEKEWVCIEFLNLKCKDYPKQTLAWDNPDFIFGKFYKFLLRYRNKNLKKKDEKNFSDIWEILNDDVVKELIECLEEAKRLNWN